MKLNNAQVQQVGSQTGLKPIPDDNPATPKLQERFGEHTFYLDANGLYIWEPVDDVEDVNEPVAAIMLAAWEGEDKQALKPMTPTRSRVVVELAPAAAS
jgi:hypothetical protein